MFLRDWSLFTGRGGLQNWKVTGSKLVVPPLKVKTFSDPPPPSPLKEWKLFAPHVEYGLNFKLLHKTTPKHFVPPPPSTWLKEILPHPFHRGKTSNDPPTVLYPPLPIISDQSLILSSFIVPCDRTLTLDTFAGVQPSHVVFSIWSQTEVERNLTEITLEKAQSA